MIPVGSCRKVVPWVLMFVLVTGAGAAQDVTAGARVGITSSIFRGEDAVFGTRAFSGELLPAEITERREALALGGSVQVQFADGFILQPELNYVRLGSGIERQVQGPADGLWEETGQVRLDNLSLPVLAKVYSPGGSGSVRSALFAGPSAGVLLHSKVRGTRTPAGCATECRSVYVTDEVDAVSTELAVEVGAEWTYRFATGRAIALDLRYRHGVTAVVTRDGPEFGGTGNKGRVQGQALGLGLRFVFAQ